MVVPAQTASPHLPARALLDTAARRARPTLTSVKVARAQTARLVTTVWLLGPVPVRLAGPVQPALRAWMIAPALPVPMAPAAWTVCCSTRVCVLPGTQALSVAPISMSAPQGRARTVVLAPTESTPLPAPVRQAMKARAVKLS